jgi:hypothetical protein
MLQRFRFSTLISMAFFLLISLFQVLPAGLRMMLWILARFDIGHRDGTKVIWLPVQTRLQLHRRRPDKQ